MPDVPVQLPSRYRVLHRIAAGGMAVVWAAEDTTLGRTVAVKVLVPHVAADAASQARFRREARTAARVSAHPNVVTVYDVGEHEGTSFLVMEHLAGGSVADALRSDGRPDHATALEWLRQAAGGLDHAHAHGIVHRDVKPGNLLLDGQGRLAVGDFGIARLAEDATMTAAGQVLGTAAYLSPEQAAGRQATSASDVYALGVVAYELLTGRRPFEGEHPAAQARAHLEADPPPSGLAPAAERALRRALAKDPAERPPTATAFAGALAAALQPAADPTTVAIDAGDATRPLAPLPAPVAPTAAAAASAPAPGGGRRGRPVPALAAGALALLALAGGGLALALGGDEPAPKQAASDERPAEADRAPSAPAEEPPADPPADPPAGDGHRSPEQLNQAGYARLQAGDVPGAISLLEASVAGFDRQGDAADPQRFGYALYNLGIAYLRAGRPDDAIRVLERRLQVSPDDQRAEVERALAEAREAAGRSGAGKGRGKGKEKGKKKDD